MPICNRCGKLDSIMFMTKINDKWYHLTEWYCKMKELGK